MKIQVDLDEDENEIVESFMFVTKEPNKKKALKNLIKESKSILKIKKAIELRK